MPDKNKHPVNVTSGALGAHDSIEKPRSSMQDFLSSTNSHDRFNATGRSKPRGLGDERDTKRILKSYYTRDEKNTGSSSMGHKKDSGKGMTGSSSKGPKKDGGKKKGTKNK